MDFNARYTVKDWPGIAVRIDGYPQKWVPFTFFDEDEDGNEIELESHEGEWSDDTESGQLIVVMVGDDRRHTVDASDLTPISDEDYCSECGQIGCNWG